MFFPSSSSVRFSQKKKVRKGKWNNKPTILCSSRLYWCLSLMIWHYSLSAGNAVFNLRITWDLLILTVLVRPVPRAKAVPTVSTPTDFRYLKPNFVGMVSEIANLSFSLIGGNLDQLDGAEKFESKPVSCKHHLCRMNCYILPQQPSMAFWFTFHTKVLWTSRELSVGYLSLHCRLVSLGVSQPALVQQPPFLLFLLPILHVKKLSKSGFPIQSWETSQLHISFIWKTDNIFFSAAIHDLFNNRDYA